MTPDRKKLHKLLDMALKCREMFETADLTPNERWQVAMVLKDFAIKLAREVSGDIIFARAMASRAIGNNKREAVSGEAGRAMNDVLKKLNKPIKVKEIVSPDDQSIARDIIKISRTNPEGYPRRANAKKGEAERDAYISLLSDISPLAGEAFCNDLVMTFLALNEGWTDPLVKPIGRGKGGKRPRYSTAVIHRTVALQVEFERGSRATSVKEAIRHVVEYLDEEECDDTLVHGWRKELSKVEKEMMSRIGGKDRSGGDLTPVEQAFFEEHRRNLVFTRYALRLGGAP